MQRDKMKSFIKPVIVAFSLLSVTNHAYSKAADSNQPSEQEMKAMLDMLDQLDELDRMDFREALRQASSCISGRLYSCAQEKLSEASEYANSESDKAQLARVRNDLESERKLEAKEIALAKQRKREAERRERERQREAARLRRLEMEREMESDDNLAMNTFMQGLSQGLSDLAERNAQRNLEINSAIRQANAMQEQQRREYLEEQRRAREREAEWQRKQQRYEDQQRALAEQKRKAEQERRRELELARKREAEKLARQREQERQRQEKERQLQAEKLAKQQAKKAYLDKLLSGTRLGAMNCYGEIHIGGQLPKVKPKAVGCVDVHYRVSCPVNARSTTGVLDYFTSFDMGCFGDTDKLTSDLGCKAEELKVRAVKVTECR